MKPLPTTMEDWIAEIRAAQEDAAEAIRFGPLAGVAIKPEDLFHLAPDVALKFRGLARSRRNLDRATDAALASYVATTSGSPDLGRSPSLSFAFAYLASHYGLELLSEDQADRIMAYITDQPAALLAPSERPPVNASNGPEKGPKGRRRVAWGASPRKRKRKNS